MPAFEWGGGMEILTQSTNTEGHGKARKTLSPVILKGRPTLLYQSKKMNTSFDWEESFSMPGCSAALHIGDCCGWEQGELITLLFEAWTALLCCASFKNDKRLSKERSFVLWHGSYARLNHRRLLNLCFVFFILGLHLNLDITALFSDSQRAILCHLREGHWTKDCAGHKVPWCHCAQHCPRVGLLPPRHITALQPRQGFAKRKFIPNHPFSEDFAFIES